jgi:CzcA family heavy metal efflux pump
LKLRLLVIAIAVALMYFGYAQVRGMPVDVLPEFAPPRVEIQTEALGLSAAEVEQFITVPMEQDMLNGVAWLQDIRSESVTGLSRIELIFEPGTDLQRARQVVQERLTMAHALPNVSKPPFMIQPLSSMSRTMMVRLTSDDVSPIEMSVLARWTIRPRLMGVPGVANVAIFGQRERQLQVQVDPERLNNEGVTLAQVVETTGNALWFSPLTFLEASTPGTGGFIDTPNQRLGIQHLLPIETAEDLAQITLAGENGSSLQLADVATVVEDHQPLIGDAIDPEEQGLLLVIEKFPEANTVDVTRDVEDALAALAPGLAGIELDTTVFRPATLIETEINNLGVALLLGLALVVLLIAGVFFDWRTALVSAAAIPLSMLVAVLVLHLRGETFNTLVFAGLVIALGIIIDDVITVTDTIKRRLQEHRQAGSDASTASIVLNATAEARGPIIYATLIVLLAAFPIFFLGFMGGLASEFFGPLALSYALALVASTIVAMTVTPVLAVLLFDRATGPLRESPLVQWLQRIYASGLSRVVRTPTAVYIGVAALVVIGLAVIPSLGQSMRPTIEERDLLIQWDGAPGTSHPEMSRVTALASEELRAVPGVRNVGAHVGRAITSDQVAEINAGEIWVSIDPAADYDATLASIGSVINGYPGLSHELRTYSDDRISEILSGTSHDIVMRLYGPDLGVLREKADEVLQAFTATSGVADASIDFQTEQPQVEVEVDLAKAQQYGLTPGDVRRASSTVISGIEVGNLFEEQKVFEVMVVGVPETRHSLDSVRQLLIDTPDGGQVELGDVADVRVVPNLMSIKHDSVSRYIDVTANVVNRDMSSVVGDIEARLATISFPREYHTELLGGFAEHQAAQQRLLGFGIAAAIGIYLLLQAAFSSWRLATVVFLTLPSALVGGVLAAYLGDRVISLGSLVGFLTVLGIAGRNGIMLISHYQHLEREEGMVFGPELVLRGARERLAPILMTALATGLALVPLVFRGNVFGYEIVRPMAVVILGGLITSTLLTLFAMPPLYLRFAPSAQPSAVPAPAEEFEPAVSPAGD